MSEASLLTSLASCCSWKFVFFIDRMHSSLAPHPELDTHLHLFDHQTSASSDHISECCTPGQMENLSRAELLARLQRAQDLVEQEQQLRQQEQQLRQELEQSTRKTTLTEYLNACHTHLYSRFAVQTDRSLTSKGGITRPNGKRCPTRLRAWTGFHEEQRRALGILHATFPSQARRFESVNFLETLGTRVGRVKIANERHLEPVQHEIIEAPVASILTEIGRTPDAKAAFNLDGQVVFENHPHAISDASEESQDRLVQRMQELNVSKRERSANPTGRSDAMDLMQLRADQICVYVDEDEDGDGNEDEDEEQDQEQNENLRKRTEGQGQGQGDEHGRRLRPKGTTRDIGTHRSVQASGMRRTNAAGNVNDAPDLAEPSSNAVRSGGRRIAFVVEYKAPHKLTPLCLLAGLHDMDIYRDVVNRATVPPSDDVDAHFEYSSERLVASAICQTYHYMIEAGLEYSFLTTGEATVFLKIDWTDPSTLYYHLAQPQEEVDVQEQTQPGSGVHCTAVSQILAFSLQALQARPHGHKERHAAIRNAREWEVDWELVLQEVGPSIRRKNLQQTGSEYRERRYRAIDRSPIPLRSRGMVEEGCKPLAGRTSPVLSSSDDADGRGGADPETPLRHRTRGARARQRQQQQEQTQQQRQQRQQAQPQQRSQPARYEQSSRSEAPDRRVRRKLGGGRSDDISSRDLRRSDAHVAASSSRSQRDSAAVTAKGDGLRRYCTQKCLRGLVRGTPLDVNCPNAWRHASSGERPRDPGVVSDEPGLHPLDHETWLRLLNRQLALDLDDGITPCGTSHGARGVLFTVELLSYGYVFVAKGTTEIFRDDLAHEADVYGHLARLQGRYVPVLLGVVDLAPDQPYHYCPRVRIVSLLLQSWAGVQVESKGADRQVDRTQQYRSMDRAVENIRAAGVRHGDVRAPNALWNTERAGVMMIDFERSTILEVTGQDEGHAARSVLQALSPNKTRQPGDDEIRLGTKETDGFLKMGCGKDMFIDRATRMIKT